MPDWLKTGLSMALSALVAYQGIKVDLTRTMAEVAALSRVVERHETIIEKVREVQNAPRWPGSRER